MVGYWVETATYKCIAKPNNNITYIIIRLLLLLLLCYYYYCYVIIIIIIETNINTPYRNNTLK